jgi:hypothetical protein
MVEQGEQIAPEPFDRHPFSRHIREPMATDVVADEAQVSAESRDLGSPHAIIGAHGIDEHQWWRIPGTLHAIGEPHTIDDHIIHHPSCSVR